MDTVFRGKRVDVAVKTVERDNRSFTYDVVIHPGAVVILPILDQEHILLIQNERIVIDKILWELPAGTLEADEKPIVCAKRELEEETGYSSEQLLPLCHFFSSPGFCTEKLHLFAATNLTLSQQRLDGTEKISVHPTSWQKALQMVQEGAIEDAKTIAALLYYHTFL